MSKKKQPATSRPPKRLPKQQSHAEAEAARIEAVTKILNVPDDVYVKALKDLLTNARPPISNFRAQASLLAAFRVLFFDDYRGTAEIERLRRRANDPARVRHGIELYETMDKLREIYPAKGDRVGPSCYVQQIAGEEYKRLTPEQIEIEKKARPFFGGRQKPTLQSLAGAVLGFSLTSVKRYVRAISEYTFKDVDPHRQIRIERVNAFRVRIETPQLSLGEAVQKARGLATAGQLAAMRRVQREVETAYAAILRAPAFLEAMDTVNASISSRAAEIIESMHRAAAAIPVPRFDLMRIEVPSVDHHMRQIYADLGAIAERQHEDILRQLLGETLGEDEPPD